MTNWDVLVTAASQAELRANAANSGHKVGSAGVLADGNIVVGVNIEDTSYVCILCAEQIMMGNVALANGGKLVATVAVHNGVPVAPCGRCRQLLYDHNPHMEVMVEPNTVVRVPELLPYIFRIDSTTAVQTGQSQM